MRSQLLIVGLNTYAIGSIFRKSFILLRSSSNFGNVGIAF